jgi:hypothetical protein
MNIPINDFKICVQQARSLQRIQESDKRFLQAFSHLAGDRTTGFLAYAIWRGRSNMISLFKMLPIDRQAYKIHPEPA